MLVLYCVCVEKICSNIIKSKMQWPDFPMHYFPQKVHGSREKQGRGGEGGWRNCGFPPVLQDVMLALFILSCVIPTTDLLHWSSYLRFTEKETEWLNNLSRSTQLLRGRARIWIQFSLAAKTGLSPSLWHCFPKGNLGRHVAWDASL